MMRWSCVAFAATVNWVVLGFFAEPHHPVLRRKARVSSSSSSEGSEDECGHLYGWGDPGHEPSILQRIAAAQRGGEEMFAASDDEDLTEASRVDVFKKLKREGGKLTLCAEFKRASPSKGVIAADADIGDVARAYAEAGASLVSVLTEPEWFRGSLGDMAAARRAVTSSEEERPAILRKDFVIDERMVREARRFGADAVLLIVACLRVSELKELVRQCFAYGVEPVVEAHSEREMELALDCGARVIGINNRNLHTFQLDMGATARLAAMIPAERRASVALASLSGVATRADVLDLRTQASVDSILVGETLMRAADKARAVRSLLLQDDDDDVPEDNSRQRLLAKVCGVKAVDDALEAARQGADLIGMVFAPSSKRRVTTDEAKAIVEAVRKFGERQDRWSPSDPESSLRDRNARLRRDTARGRPLTVAVVQDQALEEVRRIVEDTGVDLVQLHGGFSEEGRAREDAVAAEIGPHLRVVHAGLATSSFGGDSPDCYAVLVDAAGGGTGNRFDWSLLHHSKEHDLGQVLVAGGVDADAVHDAAADLLTTNTILGFDASSRLEQSPGRKDKSKVAAYLAAVKQASSSSATSSQ